MTDAAILAALRASVGNPDALELLALVELCMSQSATSRSHIELDNLLDRWGSALVGVAAADVRRLKIQLRESRKSHSHPAPREYDGRESPEN
jgi:hypothetical protein